MASANLRTDASQGARPSDRRSTRERAWLMIGAALALTLAASTGVLTDYWGFVWPDRLLTHPIPFGVAAALLAGYGLAQLVRREWLRTTILTAACLVAALWGIAATAVWVLFGEHEVARV